MKKKEIIISNYRKGKQAMQMVVIHTPSGLTNRKGEPGMNSKTVHRKAKSKKTELEEYAEDIDSQAFAQGRESSNAL